jgi:hypothetical protein
MTRAWIRRMRAGDFILAAVLAALAVFIRLRAENSASGATVRISRADGPALVVPLSVDTSFAVRGPCGESRISVRDGEAWIAEAPCPGGLCRRQGKIRVAGEDIVCVPNRIHLRVEGALPGRMDAVTQ